MTGDTRSQPMTDPDIEAACEDITKGLKTHRGCSPGSAALAEELIKWVEQYAAKICPPGCLPLPAQEREINLFARITVALRGAAQPAMTLRPLTNEEAALVGNALIASGTMVGEFVPVGDAKGSPYRGPTPQQIEPILDDFLSFNGPTYPELRRRCAQRIFEMCVVMSGTPITPSDNRVSTVSSTNRLSPHNEFNPEKEYPGSYGAVTSTDRCARCGCETKGEVAWVDGKEWCHPCADSPAERGSAAT
jgi:hypothetical protein